MAQTFTRLERVLQLEAQQGYQNKAVVGGIRQFVTYWVNQARQEANDELDQVLVEQVADVLMDYGRLPGTEARATMIGDLLTRLQIRRERLGQQTAPPPPKSRPSRPEQPRKEQAKPSRKESRPVQAELPHEPTPPPPPPPEPAAEPPRKPARKEARPVQNELDLNPSPPPPPPAPIRPQPRPAAQPDPEGLSQSVVALRGVGPAVAKLLEKLGAITIEDLLYLFPRRYEDYTLLKPINRLRYGDQITLIGTVWEVRARRPSANQTIVTAVITDGTGKIQATWFNQPWLPSKLQAGMQIILRGKVDQFLGQHTLQSPDWEQLSNEALQKGQIVPVYPLTQGLTAGKMRDLIKGCVEYWSWRVPDPLPAEIRDRHQLLSRPESIHQAHLPDNQEALHTARRRLAFDELLQLQLGMMGQRRDWQASPALQLPPADTALQAFLANLPYQLTGAQHRVVGEIAADLDRPLPMNRLLQGDVGAGKTVVAAAAMVIAAANGCQAAMMAPTEILAGQHFNGLTNMLAGLGLEIRLLTGSTPASERATIYQELTEGTAHIAIGTHALIQEAVQFKQLALTIIDEQHRFGVDQRQALRDKSPAGHSPHLLVMSATPIPRTLALSMYGDLDLSVLDEMPPGRQEIRTKWLRSSERERAYNFIRNQVKSGRQAYIIYPLVEESDKIEAKAAVEDYARLQQEIFPDLKLGLVHGRMSSAEKEEAMRQFYAAETNILVSTSVIEVGVDVPNSTVMVVEGANRFGLAQLHQFRGRVGRGQHQSFCLLISDSVNGDSEERLTALEQSNDGFVLAEKDLELRGPGEFFGRRQSGLPELRLASLLDVKLLEITRAEAQTLFATDPLLEHPEHAGLRQQVAKFWENTGDIS